MTVPIWFLDIDGVVNALARPAPIGHQITTAITMGRGWRIAYDPRVIEFINRVSRENLAEIRWLTTWEQDAHRSLGPTVGFDAFPAYDIPDDDSAFGWWKADIVAASIENEGRPLLWTDDDIDSEPVRDSLIAEGTASLLVSPDPQTGLETKNLETIEEFIMGVQPGGRPSPTRRNDRSNTH